MTVKTFIRFYIAPSGEINLKSLDKILVSLEKVSSVVEITHL